MSSTNTVFIKFPSKYVKGYPSTVAHVFTASDTIRPGTSSTDPLIPNTENKKWLRYGKNVFEGGKRKQNRSIKKRQSKRRRAGTKRRR